MIFAACECLCKVQNPIGWPDALVLSVLFISMFVLIGYMINKIG